VPEETFEKKKEYSQQVIELNEKENLYSKLKERFEIEQQEKQKRQKLLRTTFILLTLVGIGLTAFSFISNNMLFGIIFAVLTLVFVIGIIMSKSKEVDYSEAITDEIEEIKAQLAILDENYDLDFDLDEQYRIRDHWQQALKNKDILEEKRQYIEGPLN
ncbi:DNA repair protein Rad50, partial [Staphylococcus aureus]|nr:DNA repair protein Rad50 [Staphylococcus aureus]